MTPLDFVRISFRQVLRQRARYWGVILVISLGTACLVAVTTLGEAVELAIGRNLEILGRASLIEVCWRPESVGDGHRREFSDRDVEALRRLPLALHVAPFVREPNRLFTDGRKTAKGRLVGVESTCFALLDLRIAQGTGLSQDDVARRRPVCVIGSTIREELSFDDGNILDKTIRAEGLVLKIVGVIGGIEDETLASSVFVPITVAKTQFASAGQSNGIYVRARHWDDVSQLEHEVATVLQRTQPAYAEDMQVQHFPDKIRTIKTSVLLVKSLLFTGIATTLILGGLGIAGSMLAAVQESTRDIGLKKAVGATEIEIRRQYLAEAISVSLIGSFIGAVSGTVAVVVASGLLEMVPHYDLLLLSIVGSLCFGTVLGALAGFIPARKASRLDASEAMRFE